VHIFCGWMVWIDVACGCYGYILWVTHYPVLIESVQLFGAMFMNTVAIRFSVLFLRTHIVTCNVAYAHISHTSCVRNSFPLFAVAKNRIRYLTFVVADVCSWVKDKRRRATFVVRLVLVTMDVFNTVSGILVKTVDSSGADAIACNKSKINT